MKNETPNALINESSPYLLQHAYNPVDWKPWNEESLKMAKEQNKPLLISIGYSACHWCHVMERESFEDSSVAKLMNENFICIKVDREERPDIDHLYMDAVQLMTNKGGWPLNCFALPDGRPFYGGTYFPKEQWKNVLNQLTELYQKEPERVVEYAEKLSEGLIKSELIEKAPLQEKFTDDHLKDGLNKWLTNIDKEYGGNNYAPKFPMPNNYEFLLHYNYLHPDKNIEDHLKLTLKAMAFGGIYDQIGGGFARYSTDMEWKVPHFEKMLYDNAQLVSLYSNAYKHFEEPLYKTVVEETIAFLEREMLDSSGAYYSALDADSEGVEGKFYGWDLSEIKETLNDDEYELADYYYEFNKNAEWEGMMILLRSKDDLEVAKELKIEVDDLRERIKKINHKLLERRSKRIRPGLDDKSLSSWNALAIISLCDAYEAFSEPKYLEKALRTAHFIKSQQMDESGRLFRNFKNGRSTINGFLEDYAFSIEAFIKLYEATFDEDWLTEAEKLLNYSIEQFYDQQSSYFFFNSDEDPALVNRKIEKTDNVIPASNSSMCKSIYKLGQLKDNEEYLTLADQMLSNSIEIIERYLPYASNWAQQLMNRSNKYYEIAIVGESAKELASEIGKNYLPNSLTLGQTVKSTNLPLLANKWIEGKSLIYVCFEKSCKLPVSSTNEALKQMSIP